MEASATEQGERISWEYQHVTLTRVPGYGFGIAVSGGRDNPHFSNGDPAIAISDVLKAGPAEGKLMVNDRIISANGISLENVEYATAVQVLRDSGNTVLLVVRRRVVHPAYPEPQTVKLCLTKSKKKDDFGLVLGCKIYVRELSGKSVMDNREGGSVQEGDILLKINNHTTDGMTLKEARKLIESSKEKLNLVVRREHKPGSASLESMCHPKESQASYLESLSGPNYSSQNLYVQPPTRHPPQHNIAEDKSNLLPRGRSRGPLLDVSLSQLDRLATPVGSGGSGHHHSHHRSRSGVDDGTSPPDPLGPPRPPPPRPEDYYSSRRQLYEDDPLLQRSKQPMPDPRFITFQKEGSVGIRLTGGNEVGIFVTAVQPGSPASLQGLQPGDKILKVNDMDMKGVTREEAVLFLLSLQDQIDLIVQYRKDEYEQIVANQRGDSFHIKAHFNYDQPNKGEMSFRKGDVFHVVDTLHNGVVGSWQVFRIGRNNQEVQKGIIPNKSRAEELATAQFNATKKELTASESRGSFFRRRRGSHRRSKSLGRVCGQDHWDDVVFADSISKFPAYERVVLRHPGFVRPVVLFGPVADIAREKMLKDFPDKFTSPQLDNNLEDVPKSQKSSGIIRLSAIREIMERGKHALLDITPNAVDRLNYAQFYPIVIFLRAESKHIIKELRAGLSKAAHKSSKKLFEQCQKLEKVWGHTFSCSITLTSPELWYRKVRELIDKQQTAPVWMSESKPDESLSDDFLFPMTSRLSYASSPESDLDLSPEPRCSGGTAAQNATARLVKSSSDPSIATQEDAAPGYSAPPPYSPSNTYNKQASNYEGHNGAPAPDHHHGHNLAASQGKRRSQCGDSKYGFSPPHMRNAEEPPISSSTMHLNYPPHHHHHYHHHQTSSPAGYPPSKILNGGTGALPRSPLMHSPPLQKPPELPPRIDRSNKPTHNALSRLAADRLFVKGEGVLGENDMASGPREASDPPNYINATPHHRRGGSSSLERHNLKTNSYDSVSSYESYNNRLGPNAHDDLKCGSNGVPLSPRNHDPYRFTRSTAQPISGMEPKPSKHPDYGKYRSGDYKPLPPPKTASYKPVPPPKPKNYRPPPPENQGQWSRSSGDGNYDIQHSPQRTLDSGMSSSPIGTLRNEEVAPATSTSSSSAVKTTSSNMYQHSKPYSASGSLDGGGFSSPHQNGGEDISGGFDSGHGSSLDRNYNNPMHMGNSSQYYHNISPARGGLREGFHNHNHHGHHNHEPSGLDLANREQRGSAFELYKKPTDMRGNTMQHYLENNLRTEMT